MAPNSTREVYDSLLPNQPWTAKCVCRKVFMQPNSYALHINCCTRFKQSLGYQLKTARQRHKDSLQANEGQSGVVSTVEGQPGLSRLGKRKLSWMNESNLDVDVVCSSVRGSTQPGPSLQVSESVSGVLCVWQSSTTKASLTSSQVSGDWSGSAAMLANGAVGLVVTVR